jgi:hypothetical protein
MLAPNIDNVLKDEQKGVTYVIKAYRAITYEEKVLTVRHFYSQKKKPKVKRGDTIVIYSILGHNR